MERGVPAIERFIALKNSLYLTLVVYLFGIIFGSLITYILHMDIGKLSFIQSGADWHVYFLHNLNINVLLVIGGILFSIPTLVILFINGVFTGFQIFQTIITGQTSELLLGIMPHGIFEVPATLLSAAIGFQISSYLFTRIIRKNRVSCSYLKFAISFAVVVLLTGIAALMESYVHLHPAI